MPDKEIYQMRSGGKVSESPSGEISWRKSCVVDQEKLNKQQTDELLKLDGIIDGKRSSSLNENNNPKLNDKEAQINNKLKAKGLMDRMQQNPNTARKQNQKVPPKKVKLEDLDLKAISRGNGNGKIDYIAKNIDAHDPKLISPDDPWIKFIPDKIKGESINHHVYDEEGRGAFQRPFGGGIDGNELIGELSQDEKEANLKKELLDPSSGCFLEGPISGFIANCASDNCENHQNLDGAIDKCLEESSCTGVVQIVTGQSIYQLRADKKLRDSPRGEVTWVKLCGDKALNRIKEIAAETLPPQCFLNGPIKGFLGIFFVYIYSVEIVGLYNIT